MQAYYETEIEVSANRQVIVQLPENAPPGKVKVRIIYEAETETNQADGLDEKDRGMAKFLSSLPLNYEGGLSPEEIQARVDEEHHW